MKKIKLILFGATDEIIKIANNAIRHDVCEFIALCDNDESKQNLIYDGLPIIKINQVQEFQFDYIIVGAWYSYQAIKKQLLNVGVMDNKILPLMSVNLIKLLVEEIEVFPEEVLKNIFKDDPKRINDKIKELNDVYNDYLKVLPFDTSKQIVNFSDYPIIAHGGGGVLNDRSFIYPNSLESFLTAIESGFEMIEVDVFGIIENDIVFGHDRVKMAEVKMNGCSPLKFTEMLSIMIKNPSLKVILDIKYLMYYDYVKRLEKIDSIISQQNKDWNVDIKNRIIVETYDRKTTEFAVKHGWQCLLTAYRDENWFQRTAFLCCNFNLPGVMLKVEDIFLNPKYMKFFKDKNIPIIVQSTDSINEYSKLKKFGVTSVLTNFLNSRNYKKLY